MRRVEAHLNNLDHAPYDAVIDRLRRGERSSQDLSFYRHELMESVYMGEYGMPYLEAHKAALRQEDIPYENSDPYLYHPDVIEEFKPWFTRH